MRSVPNRRLPETIFALANSLYLSGLYLQGFLLEHRLPALVSAFTIPFYTVPLFFLSLYLISNIRRRTYRPDARYPISSLLLIVPLYAVMILFIPAILWLLYRQSPGELTDRLEILAPLVIEILSLVFLTGADKERKIGARFQLLLLWALTVLCSYILTGFWEKYAGIAFSDGLKLTYCGFVFHLVNAGILAHRFYKGVEKNTSSSGSVGRIKQHL